MLGFAVGRDACTSRSAASAAATPATAGACGVFEIIETTDEVRDPDRTAYRFRHDRAGCRRAGMTTMIDDAVAKCRAGVTSAAEVLRVTTRAVRPCRTTAIAR